MRKRKPGMRRGTTTNDYRAAIGGEDRENMWSLAYEWEDKPHRLVYDLCNEVDNLKSKLRKLQKENRELRC